MIFHEISIEFGLPNSLDLFFDWITLHIPVNYVELNSFMGSIMGNSYAAF